MVKYFFIDHDHRLNNLGLLNFMEFIKSVSTIRIQVQNPLMLHGEEIVQHTLGNT